MTEAANTSRILSWASATQEALLQISTLFQRFHKAIEPLPRRTERVIGELQLRCTLTSDSAIVLVAREKYWDAEMLCRSVLEGTGRLAFIALASEQEREARVREFLDDLPNIARVRRHHRAAELLAAVGDSQPEEWRPIRDLVLSDQELMSLQSAYPRVLQRQLAQKWALPSILRWIGTSGATPIPFNVFLHGYGMSSHFIHQDGDAIRVMRERATRSQERIDAIELAHGAGQLSEVLTYALLRAWAAYKARKLDTTPVRDITKLYQPLSGELSKAAADWHAVEYGHDP